MSAPKGEIFGNLIKYAPGHPPAPSSAFFSLFLAWMTILYFFYTILMPWLNLQATQAHGLFLGLPVMYYVAKASGCPTSATPCTQNMIRWCPPLLLTWLVYFFSKISSDFSSKRIQKKYVHLHYLHDLHSLHGPQDGLHLALIAFM